MDAEKLVGIGASVFTGIALLPQLIKIFREKHADGMSPFMLGTLFIGLILWVFYGCFKNDWIIILSNGFALLVNATIISLSLYYKNSGDGRKHQ